MFGIGMPELIVLLVIIGIPVAIIVLIRWRSGKAASPQSEVVQVVSNITRLANLLIDIIIFRIAATLLLIPFSDTGFVRSIAENNVADRFFTLFLFMLYYLFFEITFQRTPAKYITRTRVVMQDGSKPDAATIVKRTLARFVPFEPVSGSKGLWWHDNWTKTRVVKS
jgi:uncharacterized RDD family membrane protein YckC